VDKVVGKLPALETRREGPSLASVSFGERKPDKPLFSSVASPEPETSGEEGHATLLNDLLESEAERKTRRKWITSGCIFGGALVLVVFQLIHYAAAGKIKHTVNIPQATATIAEPDPNADTFADSKLGLAKPSPAKQGSETEVAPVQVDSTFAKASDKAPAAAQTRMMESQLTAPTRLPQSAKISTPSDAPPPSSLGGASMAALNGNNSMGGVFAGASNAKVSGPRVVTVSAGVAVGMLIHQTQPMYPPIARAARVQGTVVMNATISRTGKVTNLKVVSGPPMLRQSALDAVKTWQYKPYTLNGEPTEVDTTINVAFSLGG
jgi:TonB family protein